MTKEWTNTSAKIVREIVTILSIRQQTNDRSKNTTRSETSCSFGWQLNLTREVLLSVQTP
jgi:hypothetical protein